jgi:CBS domain-containing protein
MTIAAILKHKGREVVSVAPVMMIQELARLLGTRRIGAVLVQDVEGTLLGIISERDVVAAIGLHAEKALSMTVAQLMTSQVKTASPSMTVEEAMATMTQGRFRHLPVLDGGRLVGLVSIGDIVKARISAQEQEVDSLKAYVAGAA